MRYVACQTFGGGMDVGLRQAGLEMIHHVEQKGGFGLAECENNRHVLDSGWTSQAGTPDTWEPFNNIDAVIGLPPCSGFSLMSIRVGVKGKGNNAKRTDWRGVDAPVNACMWALVDYAARQNGGNGPPLVAFESVQGAGRDTPKGGLSLMRQLRARLEDRTGKSYHLTHLFHNAASLGGASIRPRYFFVASAIPFGITSPVIDRVPSLRESIGDLDLPTGDWGPVKYAEGANWWTQNKRNVVGLVDGVMTKNLSGRYSNQIEGALELGWRPGEQMIDVVRRNYELTGDFPALWDDRDRDRALRTNFQGGVYQPGRFRPERASRVLSGGCLTAVVHPWRDRMLTYREVARIMGFPDSWNVDTYTQSGHEAVFGKAVTVQSGRALGGWLKNALDGSPGAWTGAPLGERESVIQTTGDHKRVYNERTGEYGDFRSEAAKKEMASRPA